MIDTESIISYWNSKAEEIFGWTHDEVIGKCLTPLIIPEQHREAHQAGMRRYIQTGHEKVLNRFGIIDL